MHRSVATVLVVASPFLMAAPVTAEDGRTAGPVPTEAATAPGALPPAPPMATRAASPPPVEAAGPGETGSPLRAATPAVPAPTAVLAGGVATNRPALARPAVKVPPAGTPDAAAAVSDAAYAERLQAELCAARQVFCGLTRDGRYPARP